MSSPQQTDSMMLAFFAASFVLAATPGPSDLFIVTGSIFVGLGVFTALSGDRSLK